MIYALFDEQYKREDLMKNSKLYKIGIENACFSSWIFWKWIVYGVLQSILIFYVSFFGFNSNFSSINGQVGDMLLEGMYCYGAVVIICNV
jgi:magnesium-transporting ATPase (P-type)